MYITLMNKRFQLYPLKTRKNSLSTFRSKVKDYSLLLRKRSLRLVYQPFHQLQLQSFTLNKKVQTQVMYPLVNAVCQKASKSRLQRKLLTGPCVFDRFRLRNSKSPQLHNKFNSKSNFINDDMPTCRRFSLDTPVTCFITMQCFE